MKRLLAGTAVVVLWASNASANQFELRESDCRPLSVDRRHWLPVNWGNGFKPYTDECSINDDKGKTVIYVIAVSEARFLDSRSPDAMHEERPKPILFNPEGKIIGTLPYNFPDDQPCVLEVTLGAWRAGFPHRIDLYLHDPAVSGNRILPSMVWNGRAQRFSDSASDGESVHDYEGAPGANEGLPGY